MLRGQQRVGRKRSAHVDRRARHGDLRWRLAAEAAIPDEPMYLIANLAVGGNWPGSPDASTSFPARMQIDYIRALRRTGATNTTNLIKNPASRAAVRAGLRMATPRSHQLRTPAQRRRALMVTAVSSRPSRFGRSRDTTSVRILARSMAAPRRLA